jgi:hypothetical protein
MSTLARAMIAQIEAATGAGDFGAVRQALARCGTAITAGEFDAGEAELLLRAAGEANNALRDAARRMELIGKATKAAETKRRADQAGVALTLNQLKGFGDRDWTTQLLAAGNTQKGRLRKGKGRRASSIMLVHCFAHAHRGKRTASTESKTIKDRRRYPARAKYYSFWRIGSRRNQSNFQQTPALSSRSFASV